MPPPGQIESTRADVRKRADILKPVTLDFQQEDVTRLQAWKRKWLLQFSKEKWKVIYLGRNIYLTNTTC